jgi:hypothetical protein
MRSCWMLQTTGFHICKQKTIDNCTWNLSLKFIDVRIFCYLMPVIGKNMISWFYAYVEHIEIKTKTVNIIHFPYRVHQWILAIDSKCNCRSFSVYKYENPSSATFNNCAWIIFSQNTSNLTGYLFIKAFF